MPFEKGQSGNPNGRPKGIVSGRVEALAVLDKVASKVENKELLEKDLDIEFKANPKGFFRTYIMPLLPKQTEISGKGGEKLIPESVGYSDANIVKALGALRPTSKPS